MQHRTLNLESESGMHQPKSFHWVYRFSSSRVDRSSCSRSQLGGKGAALAEMSRLGIPVPPGFTLSADLCARVSSSNQLPPQAWGEVLLAVRWLEGEQQRRFDSADGVPLLVSVRSGAAVSMPGMMDTVLNLGLNNENIARLADHYGDEAFAQECYARFLRGYGTIVMGIDQKEFDDARSECFTKAAIPKQSKCGGKQLNGVSAKAQAVAYERVVARNGGYPQDPRAQLSAAIMAVFRSWNSPRAKLYRKLHRLPESLGTAVNVQAMVFGNRGSQSATGVAFTRNPNTGEPGLYGEWLPGAQGEDVVAGIRTPQPLTEAPESLEQTLPDCFRTLDTLRRKLEAHYADMQDIEFTIEQGELYVLQTRSGKRTAEAAVRIAVDLADEGLISKEEALLRVDPGSLSDLLFSRIDETGEREEVARGLAASPGAVSGVIALDNTQARSFAEDGLDVILVRQETSPDDLEGISSSCGILTGRGGATSHAAVVARSMGKSCVVGCGSLRIDEAAGRVEFTDAGITLQAGDLLSLDGASGAVFHGRIATLPGTLTQQAHRLLQWADETDAMDVRANADTPEQAEQALEFGARGIGLCRTEHMFFSPERLPWMQRLILAESADERSEALDQVEAFQREDFIRLFRAMAGLPVTIRLLDPPLHEFLPRSKAQLTQLAQAHQLDPALLQERIDSLQETNPMLGHRGVRLSVSYPEIVQAQVAAIISAACEVARTGVTVHPEIKVPLVMNAAEMKQLRRQIDIVSEQIIERSGQGITFKVGAMIELPKAALTAGAIAQYAQFYSFGTNDLTQTTLGLSRDDSARFLETYTREGLLPVDPFVTIDRDGVGELMRQACDGARRARPNINIGVCGEHGGDPDSISFCEQLGLDYVSCSPFRVPVARLACAQARLRKRQSADGSRAELENNNLENNTLVGDPAAAAETLVGPVAAQGQRHPSAHPTQQDAPSFIFNRMLQPNGLTALMPLLSQITEGSKVIARRLERASLTSLLGAAGRQNVHGEDVQKLDLLANNTLVESLSNCELCRGIASEELDRPAVFESSSGRYLVVADPLDGSSNLDVNNSVGTIFGVLPSSQAAGRLDEREFLAPGSKLLAAGYVIYGPSTMLVLNVGSSVHGFTLDPNSRRYYLSHPALTCPDDGHIYSVNEGNSDHWTPGVKRWNQALKREQKTKLRYVGSLVADAHRTLLHGGIFAYPGDALVPNGKLRLLYEANPLAKIFEAAGGAASAGQSSILELRPTSLHQRVPLVIGSKRRVEQFERHMSEGPPSLERSA